MKKIKTSFEHVFIPEHLLKCAAVSVPVAKIIGSVTALFLWLLEQATSYRLEHLWLLFLLPAAGIFGLARMPNKAKTCLCVGEIHKPGWRAFRDVEVRKKRIKNKKK